MTIILCVDNRFGMMFNHRRQSRDRNVIDDIAKNFNEIHMNSYSQSLFVKYKDKIKVSDFFLSEVENDSVCFIENNSLKNYQDKIDQIIIYKWNMDYPADVFFEIPLQTWKLINVEEFTGYSHEKITKEIYKRRG